MCLGVEKIRKQEPETKIDTRTRARTMNTFKFPPIWGLRLWDSNLDLIVPPRNLQRIFFGNLCGMYTKYFFFGLEKTKNIVRKRKIEKLEFSQALKCSRIPALEGVGEFFFWKSRGREGGGEGGERGNNHFISGHRVNQKVRPWYGEFLLNAVPYRTVHPPNLRRTVPYRTLRKWGYGTAKPYPYRTYGASLIFTTE